MTFERASRETSTETSTATSTEANTETNTEANTEASTFQARKLMEVDVFVSFISLLLEH